MWEHPGLNFFQDIPSLARVVEELLCYNPSSSYRLRLCRYACTNVFNSAGQSHSPSRLGTACAMAAVGILATIDPNAPLAPPSVAKLGNAAFPMSLVLNILVTGLILGRMWFISRAPRVALSSQRTGPPRVYSAMAVVVESGLLFLIAQIVFVTLFALGNPAQDVVMPITLQIYVCLFRTAVLCSICSSQNSDNCVFVNRVLLQR